MADIELVIKIPEEMYKWVNDVNRFFDDYGISDFIDLVKNGTPLPKGHGRLIDADKLQDYFWDNRSKLFQSKDCRIAIDNAPTVEAIPKADYEARLNADMVAILDKIRAEIEQEYTKFRNKSDMWNERACGLGTALEIIDKYKAEGARAEDGNDD